jgi:cobalt-zinc-cadmium efflux system outer membrane protein
MRSFNIVALCTVLVISDAASAAAQSVPGRPIAPLVLTVNDAIQQALARNRDLAVGRRDVEISRGKLQQARRYPFNPELGIEGEGGRGVGRQESDRRGIGGGKVGLSQVVEIRGQRDLRIRGGRADLVRAEWTLRETERDIVADVTKTFSDLLLVHERIDLTRETLRLATELRDTAKALVDAGDAPELDLLRAAVEVRRAGNRVTVEEAGAAALTRTLALLIGAQADVPITATGPLMLDGVPGTLDELLTVARSNRPDLKAAEATVESARATRDLIIAERFVPTVTFSASYGEGLDFDARTRLALFGVSIPLPLWNRRDGDVEAARAEVAKHEAERERILARIDKEVTSGFTQVAASQRVVEEYLRNIVPAQGQATELMREGYRLGQFRLSETLFAQRDALEARTGYLDAIASYNAARVELQRSVGVRP